jgi:arylsulfatase A
VDFFPTLVDLCGLTVPARAKPREGVSLRPVLEGRTDRTDAVRFWQWNRAQPNYTHNAAMRDGAWKLVRPFESRAELTGDATAAPVLYHLPTDPAEAIDLSAQHPERYARMRAALAAWSEEVERERQRPGR